MLSLRYHLGVCLTFVLTPLYSVAHEIERALLASKAHAVLVHLSPKCIAVLHRARRVTTRYSSLQHLSSVKSEARSGRVSTKLTSKTAALQSARKFRCKRRSGSTVFNDQGKPRRPCSSLGQESGAVHLMRSHGAASPHMSATSAC